MLDARRPGIPQAIRADSIAKTPHGLLSRGVAGTVGATLVVNLPARPARAATATRCCGRRSTHALELLADQKTATDHVQT